MTRLEFRFLHQVSLIYSLYTHELNWCREMVNSVFTREHELELMRQILDYQSRGELLPYRATYAPIN